MPEGVVNKLKCFMAMTLIAGVPIVTTFTAFYKIFRGSLNTKLFLLFALLLQYTVNSHLFRVWRGLAKFLFDPNNYFQAYKIVYEDESIKKQTKNILFCLHPHGIFTLGIHFLHIYDQYFNDNSYILATRLANETPFWGFWTRLMGCNNANPKSLDLYMQNQQNCTLVPGGFEEAAITSFQSDNLYLNNRKGFIKYALRYGYSVCPIFTFGENKLFYSYDGLHWLRILASKTKFIPGVIFWSKYILTWLPNDNVRLVTVIGTPIQFPKIENPSKQIVNEYHEKYINHLKEMFNKFKVEYGDKNSELQIYPKQIDSQKNKSSNNQSQIQQTQAKL